nr:hypothetical protein [Pseudomonas sp.]
MTEETQISLLVGLILSLPIGLYSGIIIARYSKFSELRDEALRIVRTISYMQEERKIIVSEKNDLPKLTLISSELLFRQHQKAADSIITLSAAIADTNHEAESGKTPIETYEQRYLHWQKIVRELQPSIRRIFAIAWSV